jgi:hypothetical protein
MFQMPDRSGNIDSNAGNSPDGGTLHHVWAMDGNLARAVVAIHATAATGPQAVPAVKERTAPVFRTVLSPTTAFYRGYTEAMLRRYGVLSLESGRVPSLLGREMFRGKVTSYRVHAFDDVVIFVHDVEQCIKLLKPGQQQLIHRIGVQEYTFGEAASMLLMSLRSVQRRYFDAVDELTVIFLKRRLLERLVTDACQEGEGSTRVVSHLPA